MICFNGSEYVQGFHRLFMSVLPLKYQVGTFGPKPGPGLSTSYVVIFEYFQCFDVRDVCSFC